MKIALVAPVEEPVPPRTYGGIELVVYNLAEELVRIGHDITLLASGDSRTSARLVPIVSGAIRTDPDAQEPASREALKLAALGQIVGQLRLGDYDIIHNHTGWRLLPFAGDLRAPVLTTLHGPMNVAYYPRVFGALGGQNFVSISNSQRRPLPSLNYVATIYNGIDTAAFTFNPEPADYLVWLGRLSPEKGPVQAILSARAAGVRLILAGKIDVVDTEYFAREVEPLIDGERIRFVGEVDHAQKNDLLRNARAILVPIAWEEPFGLVMVEALATGTPVIANGRGSVPELITPEVGYVCDTPEQMTAAIRQLNAINRAECRAYAVQHFDRALMARRYLAAYESVLSRSRATTDAVSGFARIIV